MDNLVNRVPFTAYDFFGHLSAGFVFLAAVDYAFDLRWLLHDDHGLVTGVFWVVAAYIVGHIIANLAGDILEDRVVRKRLRSPEETLFMDDASLRRRHLLPGHHKPLPTVTRDRVLAKAKERSNIDEPGRALFCHCHPLVIRHQVTRERLDAFLNLYGFCRNVCMALLLSAVVLLAGAISDPWRTGASGVHVWWAILFALIAAVGMFYRYLKFFREYTAEVFRTYAEID